MKYLGGKNAAGTYQRIGGVMRCCVETLNTTPVVENEGDILPCKHCSSSLRVRDGAWEWNRNNLGEYNETE